MQHNKMIGLEDANDYYRIQNNSFLIGVEKLSQAVLEWETYQKNHKLFYYEININC